MRSITLALIALSVTVMPAAALQLAVDGAPAATVVQAAEAATAEHQAALEVTEYLGRAAGCDFPEPVDELAWGGGPAIYVGQTAFARAHGIDFEALGPEEWIIRTVDDGLILAGGRPRGTLYAVSHFLEDVVGIHWWNPWEDFVPALPTINVADLALSGEPAIAYRDIYRTYGYDGGRFAARSRLNRMGDPPIAPEWGGGMNYGPPYHVHTFNLYFRPNEHFETHPEWYSLIDGERSGDHTQLCLTNQELREAYAAKLLDYIETSWAAAREADLPPPLVFEISQNDWRGACQCENCQAIVAAEGGEAGPLIDFVNYMADSIKDDYPDILIGTLAYSYTEDLPKTIRPRDNVVVRLCDTRSNPSLPLTDEANTYFRERMAEWSTGAKNLRVWDYAVTYDKPYGMPMPSVHTYQPDFQFYLNHNVEGVFTELEMPVTADMRDFKVWMMCKLLEDPYRDYEALVDTFMNGCYGPAGIFVKQYLRALEAAAIAKPAHLGMHGALSAYTYIDADFCIRAHELFDQAEAAVAGDEVLMRRVRHARLPLDRATAYMFRRIASDWMQAGNAAEDFPFERDDLTARARDTWLAQIDSRVPESGRVKAIAAMDAELMKYTALPAFVELPEKFRGLPAGSVVDFTADTTRNWKDIVEIIADEDAESTITNRLQFPARIDPEKQPLERYKFPMPWGVYDKKSTKGIISATIQPNEVPGPGYHWYKLGTTPIGPGYYVYFFWSWIIQVDVGAAHSADAPDQKFDVWARMKFEGPDFPHGQEGDANAISVERVILVKSDAAQ